MRACRGEVARRASAVFSVRWCEVCARAVQQRAHVHQPHGVSSAGVDEHAVMRVEVRTRLPTWRPCGLLRQARRT